MYCFVVIKYYKGLMMCLDWVKVGYLFMNLDRGVIIGKWKLINWFKKKIRVFNNKYMIVYFKSVGVYLYDKLVYINMMR